MDPAGTAKWTAVLGQVIERSHLVTGDELSAMIDDAVRPLGLTAEVLLVDLGQRVLSPVGPEPSDEIAVEGTLAGRAFQLGKIVADTDSSGRRLLWVPMLDGTERAGVLCVGLDGDVADDEMLRRNAWALSGIMGHVIVAKLVTSDRLRRLRDTAGLSVASELLWQLLPPRTMATDTVVVTALLEPFDRVAGDAYDYSVDSHGVTLAVFDGLGHDLPAAQSTMLALTAIRNARRSGEDDLVALAARADELLWTQPGPLQFVTAVLARLDLQSGVLRYLLAGHPPPLLLRGGHIVKELAIEPRPPLGIRGGHRAVVAEEQLEPGDRLLLYSDGITEARNTDGEFFGLRRLADFTERAELDGLPAPETLRRLAADVLAHQKGRLQDDATLLLVDWSAATHQRMFPLF